MMFHKHSLQMTTSWVSFISVCITDDTTEAWRGKRSVEVYPAIKAQSRPETHALEFQCAPSSATGPPTNIQALKSFLS